MFKSYFNDNKNWKTGVSKPLMRVGKSMHQPEATTWQWIVDWLWELQWRLSIFTNFHVTSAQSFSNHEAHCSSPPKNRVERDLFLFSKHQSKNLGASQMLFHSLPLWKAVTHHTVPRQRNEKCEKSSNLVVFFWLKFLWLHGRQWPSSLPVTVEIYKT